LTAPGFELLGHCFWNQADQAAVAKYTKKKKASDWTKRTLSDVRSRLRTELIRSQGSACAYCRRRISEELGLHDVDHILPKGVATYVRFTYERLNLVASCKRCNRNKLDQDILKTKPLAVGATYPMGVDDYVWVHPYIHRYSEHIRIRDGLIFEAVGADDQKARGLAVINACGLKTLPGVEHRRAGEAALYASNAIDAITSTISQHPKVDEMAIVTILRRKRKDLRALQRDGLQRIVSAFRRQDFSGFERELRSQGIN
jgi:hypothetical protein